MNHNIANYDNITSYVRNCENIISDCKAQHNPNIKEPYWHLSHKYSISDKLIEIVGRYCEINQSDFLITYQSFLNELNEKIINQHFFIFGVRRMGVDGINNLEFNINENPTILSNDYYRAIYAIQITETNNEFTGENELKIELKNISHLSVNSLK